MKPRISYGGGGRRGLTSNIAYVDSKKCT